MVVLYFGYQYTVLEAFIIGAALSVTSLGTTIAIMSSLRSSTPANDARKENSVISETRVGTILLGAAVIDDIPGLVISSVVTNIGSNSRSQLSAWVIARPICSSLAILLVTAILARYISPLFIALLPSKSPDSISQTTKTPIKPELNHQPFPETRSPPSLRTQISRDPGTFKDPEIAIGAETCGEVPGTYMRSKRSYYEQIPNLALLLFIAIVSVYVTIAYYIGSSRLIGAFCAGSLMGYCWKQVQQAHPGKYAAWSPHASFDRISSVQNHVLAPFFFASIGAAIPVRSLFQVTTAWRGILYSALMITAKLLAGAWLPIWTALERRLSHHADREFHEIAASWPAGLFVGLALVTRGEIGLLILNIAKTQELVSEEGFAVGIWAVVLSTLIGPIGVGALLRTRAFAKVMQGPWGCPPKN